MKYLLIFSNSFRFQYIVGMRIQPPRFELFELFNNLRILREGNVLPIECPFCEIVQRQFWRPSEYYNHVDRNHNDELDVLCGDPDCEIVFFDNLTINFHNLRFHERPPNVRFFINEDVINSLQRLEEGDCDGFIQGISFI